VSTSTLSRQVLRPSETADSLAADSRRTRTLQTALVALVIVVGAGFAIVSVVDRDAYARLIAEDGPAEYASAALWLAAAATAGATLVVLARRRRTATPLTWLVYGLGILFFVASGGEEISWGQRLIGYGGPDRLVEINKQGETNLHNIGSISLYANAFLLLTLVAFLLVPFAVRRNARLRGLIARHDLPLVPPAATRVFLVVVAVWVFVGLRFGTLGFSPFSAWGHYTQLDDELFELGAAYAFFAWSCLDLSRRLSASSP
jgi:hypothetical protein